MREERILDLLMGKAEVTEAPDPKENESIDDGANASVDPNTDANTDAVSPDGDGTKEHSGPPSAP